MLSAMAETSPDVVLRPDNAGANRETVFGWVSLVARLILGGSLLVAGLMKIGNLPQSVVAVKAYQLNFLPDWLITFIGNAMPFVEILLGAVIIAGLFTRWTSLLGGLLMLAFIALLTQGWMRQIPLKDCGCFGPGGMVTDPNGAPLLLPGWWQEYLISILRDIGFVACAVWVVLFPKTKLSVDAWIGGKDSLEPLDDLSDLADLAELEDE